MTLFEKGVLYINCVSCDGITLDLHPSCKKRRELFSPCENRGRDIDHKLIASEFDHSQESR